MADAPTTAGGPVGGPGSADPKAILRDLKQLAIVAQKLGIDLQKTAAMGTTVAGQKGNTQSSISDTHKASMPGGGSGYTNLAAGHIIGSTTSQAMAKGFNKSNALAIMAQLQSGRYVPPTSGGRAAVPSFLPKAPGSQPLPGYIPPHGYNQPSGPASPWMPTSKATGPKPSRNDFGQAANRRFNRQFTTYHGLMMLYGALTDPVNEQAGESRLTKLNDAASSTAKMMAVGELMSSASVAREAYMASRAAGTSKAFAAGKSLAKAGPAAAAAAAAVILINEWENVAELNKEYKKSKWQLGSAKEGWSPAMRPSLKPALWKPSVDDEAARKFNFAAKWGSEMFWIDDKTGERKEKGFWGKLATRLPFVSGYGEASAMAKEKEWRIKEAEKAHKSAIKKGEVMDWEGAIKETEKAKSMIVAEEAMPFFWKQPEKFLRAMESSRIAGRNWARSQQPRGASRTGD